MIEANGMVANHAQLVATMTRSASGIGRRGQLVAVEAATGEPVAFVPVSNVTAPGSWNVGLWVTPAKRGKGFSVEALRGVMELLHEVGVEVAHLGTAVDNEAMKAAAVRSGCTFDEVRPHKLPNGTTVMSNWYSHRAE